MEKNRIKESRGYMTLLGDIDKNIGTLNEEPVTEQNGNQGETVEVEEPVREEKRKKGRPRTNMRKLTKSSQEGLPEGLTRATIIVNEDSLKKVKVIATLQDKKLKDIMTELLDKYVEKYEREHGTIRME